MTSDTRRAARRWGLVLAASVASLAMPGGLRAAADPAEEGDGSEALARIAAQMRPVLVQVEYTLRFDKGDEPEVCGYRSGNGPRGRGYFDVHDIVPEERPLVVEGVLVGATRVLSPDPMIHPRFVEAIAVRHGDATVEAEPARYLRDQNGVVLALKARLEGTRPLRFDAALEAPYVSVTYVREGAAWYVDAQSVSGAVSAGAGGPPMQVAPFMSLITDGDGLPVGMTVSGELPTDGAWKGDPLLWPGSEAAEMAAWVKRIEALADRTLVRVQLTFRSPRDEQQSRGYGGDGGATVQNVLGVVLGPRTVLVAHELEPSETARLERVEVFVGDAEAPVEATFAQSLRDYGALLVTPTAPLPAHLEAAPDEPRALERRLLVGAEVRIQGQQRQVYVSRRRIRAFEEGWRRHLYPRTGGEADHVFLFDERGRLVALPLARREKAQGESRHWRSNDSPLTLATQLAPVLADPAAYADADNVPLPERDEHRIGWMGVILQRMTTDLARMTGVAHQTRDGETGAVVSYVYPGSPAARAGVEPGWILARLLVPEYPKPVEVQVEYNRYGEYGFPWERLDEVHPMYFDRLPLPWPSPESGLARTLTEVGFGKPYRAVFLAGGKEVVKPMEVEQSPPHYASAPRYKSEALGLTVRDMTFEVRRYFQKETLDPGVVVSKVEPGSKAHVGGIKPFEVVTHVNDRPVADVAAFEAAVAGQEELRLAVKRMLTGRVVRLRNEGAAPASEPE